jgi:hypothetical protein
MYTYLIQKPKKVKVRIYNIKKIKQVKILWKNGRAKPILGLNDI